MAARPIGVFDSGIGGMTVVKELFETVPNESIVYFGDSARVPVWNEIGRDGPALRARGYRVIARIRCKDDRRGMQYRQRNGA